MEKYIITIFLLTLFNYSHSQKNWDGEYPWVSRDQYGDIRRGISFRSFSSETYVVDRVKDCNKGRIQYRYTTICAIVIEYLTILIWKTKN